MLVNTNMPPEKSTLGPVRMRASLQGLRWAWAHSCCSWLRGRPAATHSQIPRGCPDALESADSLGVSLLHREWATCLPGLAWGSGSDHHLGRSSTASRCCSFLLYHKWYSLWGCVMGIKPDSQGQGRESSSSYINCSTAFTGEPNNGL